MKRILFVWSWMLTCLVAGAQTGQEGVWPGSPQTEQTPRGRNEALAEQFYREGDYQKAAELYEQLYSEYKGQQHYRQLINSLFHLEEFDRAEGWIRKLAAAAPTDYRYQLDLGNLYNKRREPEKARTHFEAVLKHLPAENHLISGIAYSLYSYGEKELAISALQKARQRAGDPTAFSFELARLYYLDRQPPEMIRELLDLATSQPGYVENIKGQLQFYLRDETEFKVLEEILVRRMKRDKQNPVYPRLLIWRHLQQSNFEKATELAMSLDAPEEEHVNQLFQIAAICSANEAHGTAADIYRYLMDKGENSPWYRNARIHFLNARKQELLATAAGPSSADLLALEENYESLLSEFGKNRELTPVMQELAQLKGRHLNKVNEAIDLLEETIALSGDARFRAECKLELGDLYILADDVWEATLVYGQVEKDLRDTPLGQEARFRNARLSYYIGEFEWARGQLDVLKAATSQLMANDALNLSLLISENPGPDSTYAALRMYAGAELLAFRNLPDEALAMLDSIHVQFPDHALHDDILMAKANIFMQQGRVDQALAAYLQVVEQHRYAIWADDALFKLGQIHEKELDDPEKAQQYYEKLLLEHAGSLYITEARKRFRTLRGDLPAAAEEEEFINEPIRF